MDPRTARPYVIVAADFIRTGGMDRANYALARHLARHGHETHLVSFSVAPDLAAEPNVRVHIAPRPAGKHTLGGPFLGSLAIAESLRAGSGAQLIANGGNCLVPGAVNWVHWVAAAYARVRTKRSVRNLIGQTTERLAIRRARLVLANSERTKEELVDYVGVDEARIRVVYLGVDAADFRPRTDAERAQIRATLGWPAERLKVVFVGALADERKGFETLYSAWTRLCRSPDWDADLVVIGAGRLLDAWRERARADGMGDRLTFLGFRSDVPLVVGACDLLVAPSLYEPYGLAVHEALCSGVPAIASAVSGVTEVYPGALADWILPDPRDDVDLADRIERWRATARVPSPELRALSDRLRARDWDVVAADIVALCEA
jgi:glycosyltransferase involved in cell wall biosynthesis